MGVAYTLGFVLSFSYRTSIPPHECMGPSFLYLVRRGRRLEYHESVSMVLVGFLFWDLVVSFHYHKVLYVSLRGGKVCVRV